MNTTTMEPADFAADVQETFNGNGLVPLVIADRDAATGPFRHAANARKVRIQQNPDLSDGQRRHALEMLRQQTEAEMRLALGERNFHAFKAFNQWWFRELSMAD
jgi:hypothetical protein